MGAIPHMVLNWIHNADTQELTCDVAEGLRYYAHRGGYDGYTKVLDGVESHVKMTDWDWGEKMWLSENYGATIGVFQHDPEREGFEKSKGQMEGRAMGIGPNDEYLDHMQRLQTMLEGGDMAIIERIDFRIPEGTNPAPLFWTPDNGLTVYKTLPTANTYYNGRHNKEHIEEDGTWQMTPQPCMMQPNSLGRILSDYDEMRTAGCPEDIITELEAGEWDNPPFPEFQANFVYPTVNTVPITADNVNKIWD